MMATGFMGYVAAVGSDELLGRHRHHQPVLRHSAGRRNRRHLAVGRLFGRQPDAQPLLLAALPAAVRDRRRRRAACLGAARGRAEQSRPASSRRSDKDTRAVHALCDHQGQLRAWWCSSCCSARGSCSIMPELSRPCRQLHSGQSGGDADAHRAGMVLPAVLRDPARDPEQAGRRHRDVRPRSPILAFLPWLDTSKVRSARYRPLFRQFFWMFVLVCVGLGWLGAKPAEGGLRHRRAHPHGLLLRALPRSSCRCSAGSRRPKPLPNSISESVLGGETTNGKAAPARARSR